MIAPWVRVPYRLEKNSVVESKVCITIMFRMYNKYMRYLRETSIAQE